MTQIYMIIKKTVAQLLIYYLFRVCLAFQEVLANEIESCSFE